MNVQLIQYTTIFPKYYLTTFRCLEKLLYNFLEVMERTFIVCPFYIHLTLSLRVEDTGLMVYSALSLSPS